ncbi:MAG: ribosomal-protein-alanine N-acetyltransferase [Ruminococcaceae bacterium]|nr:ribosomal-protein-alanine N-acetyltransferase [Oscillospiraceae bacterium]
MTKSEKDNRDFCYSVSNPDDAGQIFEIEKECFSSRWSEKLISDEISNKNSRSFVCKTEGNAVGYIFFKYIFDEGEILRVCVNPRFRKNGIASHLMKMVMDFALLNGVEKIFLEVRESNDSAIALYSKFGFEQYSKRSNYYTDNGEDAILMQKILISNEESE